VRRHALLAAVITACALPLLTASPATADERHCYTVHVNVGNFDTIESCQSLPVDLPPLES
jgi:hypothetical protein